MSKLIEKADAFSERAHAGQRYSAREEYIYHPRQVADFARRLGYDERIIAAALLHDTVEITSVTIQEIEAEFGLFVASSVEAVTYMTEDKTNGIDKIKKAKSHIGGHVVKLCDSSCNLANGIIYGPKPSRNQKEAYDLYSGYLDELRQDLPSPEQVAAVR